MLVVASCWGTPWATLKIYLIISTIKHVPIPMKTKQCKMKQGCCLVTFCPLVPSWATTIHKFHGFEAGFDKNDQFQHLIINPGDIKTEQQQPGIFYVAMSHAKKWET